MGESICRYCGEQIKANEAICSSCGYNPQTRTMTEGFHKKGQEPKSTFLKTANLHLPIFIIGIIAIICMIVFFPDKVTKAGNSIISYFSNMAEDVRQYHRGLKPDSTTQAGLSNLAANIKESREIMDSFLNENFAYKPAGQKAGVSIRLEGIVFDSTGKGSAIINGQVLYEGDNIGNSRIIKINKNSVELKFGGENKILEVNQTLP